MRYYWTCKYIDTMTELPEDERKHAKEMARQKLFIVTVKYAAHEQSRTQNRQVR